MKLVHQTDFTPASGNALQACFATIFEEDFDTVPNFITQPGGYINAIQSYLAPKKLGFIKLPPHIFEEGQGSIVTNLQFPVIIAGKSPRGDFKHCVVGKLAFDKESKLTKLDLLDPHPEHTNLEDYQWVGIFVSLGN